jgi:uncharacterized protein
MTLAGTLSGMRGGLKKMRRSLVLSATVLLVLATAGPSTMAENNWDIMRDPTVNRGGPLIILLPNRSAAKPARPQRKPVVVRPASSSAPVIVHDAPVLPKVDPNNFIVVLGDTLAELLANGLEDAFADRPDVAIIKRNKADSGLVRTDFHDWNKSARELLASDQKITVGVMILGQNDRQAIREGDVTHEPLGERWREIYRERIDAIAAAFAERKVPLVWVGAPPMQNSRLSADMISLNEMFRQRVERTGGTYVDLWEAFIDPENRYTASGPDLTGQVARLRAADGVHFTRAGSRKAAHFADMAIRRFLQNAAPASIIALPPVEVESPRTLAAPNSAVAAAPVNVEDLITRMAGLASGQAIALPAPALVPVKPVAGPILQLSGLAPARDGALISDIRTARGSGSQAVEIDRVFAEGVAPSPRPGRADDFRWPKR